MKKIILIALFTFIFLTVGCLDNYIPIEEYNNEIALYESQLEEANSETKAKSKEISELKEEVNTLENDLDLSNEETKKYQNLIANLNELLENVYYGYAENEQWINNFTAFSIEYNDTFYLITAGHTVEDRDGKYYNHRFKANFNDIWIYPKLLAYKNDFYGSVDYAVFYSDKISSGLSIDYDNDYPQFILGTTNNDLNVLRKNNQRGKDGECGSPAIDLEGEAVGIFRGRTTPIEKVIEAIDNLE